MRTRVMSLTEVIEHAIDDLEDSLKATSQNIVA
jgi:predicted DNA-binding protein